MKLYYYPDGLREEIKDAAHLLVLTAYSNGYYAGHQNVCPGCAPALRRATGRDDGGKWYAMSSVRPFPPVTLDD